MPEDMPLYVHTATPTVRECGVATENMSNAAPAGMEDSVVFPDSNRELLDISARGDASDTGEKSWIIESLAVPDPEFLHLMADDSPVFSRSVPESEPQQVSVSDKTTTAEPDIRLEDLDEVSRRILEREALMATWKPNIVWADSPKNHISSTSIGNVKGATESQPAIQSSPVAESKPSASEDVNAENAQLPENVRASADGETTGKGSQVEMPDNSLTRLEALRVFLPKLRPRGKTLKQPDKEAPAGEAGISRRRLLAVGGPILALALTGGRGLLNGSNGGAPERASQAQIEEDIKNEIRVPAGEWVKQHAPQVLRWEEEVADQISEYFDDAVEHNAKAIQANLAEAKKKDPKFTALMPLRQVDSGLILPLIMLTSGGGQSAEPPVYHGKGLTGITPELGKHYVKDYNPLNAKHSIYAAVMHVQYLLDRVDESQQHDRAAWLKAAMLGNKPGEGYFQDQAESERLAKWLPLIEAEWSKPESAHFNELLKDDVFQKRFNAALNGYKEETAGKKG